MFPVPIAAIMIVITSAIFTAPAAAQNLGGAFDGMASSDDPIQIQADRLEVADQKGTAVFSGNVEIVQGSTFMKSSKLLVYYGRDAQGNPGPGGNVKRIEATGGVAVRSKDQHASANKAVVNMETQIATLNGNVAVSQGTNIIQGCLVTVNMKTNDINVEPCAGKSGRVQVLIDRAPSSNQQ
ncbi:MAG: lipopolysaccharide transport periplasmic protein LptA [Rhizobiaceae bacterium]